MRTAVITGGAGGLGRALAALLTARGWQVALLDLPGPALEAAAGPGLHPYPCDVTDAAAVAATCARLQAELPPVALAVYNAGVTHVGLFADTPLATHRRVFEINYFGALNLATALLPALRASKGTHLAISSVAGFAPLYRRTAYSASKHAMEGFFRTLREEEREHGVRVVLAMPSFIATNIGRPGQQADGITRPGAAADGIDYISADTAAATILRGLDRGRETIPVGRVAALSWLLSRIAPRAFARQMMKRVAGAAPPGA